MSGFTRIPDIPLDDTPIFRNLAREWGAGLGPTGGAHHWRDARTPIDDQRARLDPPTTPLPAGGLMTEPVLDTADHVATEGDRALVDPIPDDIVIAEHHDYVAPHAAATPVVDIDLEEARP